MESHTCDKRVKYIEEQRKALEEKLLLRKETRMNEGAVYREGGSAY